MEYRGLVQPASMTTAQRDALSLGSNDTAAIFNTTSSCYEFWGGATWTHLEHPMIIREFVGSQSVPGNTSVAAADFTTTLVDRGQGSLQASGNDGIQILEAGVYAVTVEVTFTNGSNNSQMAFGYNINGANPIWTNREVRAAEGDISNTFYSVIRVRPFAANDIIRCQMRRNNNTGTQEYTEYALKVRSA